MTRIIVFALGLLIVSTPPPALADHPQTNNVLVNCAAGETLNEAIAANIDSDKRLVIEFTGTCTEAVIISRDDVTIRGADASATVVGRIFADGKVRSRFTGFTIRDTPPDPRPNGRLGDAILLNATVGTVVEDLRIIRPGGNGITTDDGQVKVRNVTVTGCGGIGIASGMSGSFLVSGTLVTNGCQGAGIQVGFGSQLTAQFGTVIEANDNLSWGILVQTQGQVTIFRGTRVSVLRNGIGIQVSNKGSLTHGDGLLDVSDNRTFGILVGELSDMTPFGGIVPNIRVSGNGVGIAVIRRSFLRTREGTVVSGNLGPGLLVDASDVAVQGTTIQNNGGPDALLVFGSTATFDGGNTLGTALACDSTALARGQFSCPSTSTATAMSEQNLQAERWLAAARDALQ